MRSKELSFRIVFRPEPEGGFTVTVPSLPGCVTYGETLDEARKMAHDAIIGYLESMAKHHEEIRDDDETFEGVLRLRYV